MGERSTSDELRVDITGQLLNTVHTDDGRLLRRLLRISIPSSNRFPYLWGILTLGIF